MDFLEVREDYKQFLIPILTQGIYLDSDEVQKCSSPEVENEALLEVGWNFLIYDDEFLYTYELVPQTFNMDCVRLRVHMLDFDDSKPRL